jgi:DNA-binding MarR family transcriptional regulator
VNPKREKRIAALIQVWQTIRRALQGTLASEWLQVDLTMAQIKGLFVLQCSGAKSIGDLAEALGVGLPAASLLIDKLEQAQLAVRREDPTDRRRTFVELTGQGAALATRLLQGSRERIHLWLAQLDEEDFDALARGLEALAQVASAERDGAGR